jgi:uncharacterized protein
MTGFTYSMAFIMGLTMSLHCAGMCGPIVWIMPFQHFRGFRKAIAIAGYHLGRMSAYATLALALYSFRSIFSPSIQSNISIAMGCLLLAMGIISFLPAGKLSVNLPWADAVKKNLGRFVAKPSPAALTVAGFLNGLLPCGLVYVALSASLAAQSYLQAAAAMYCFGAGTVPMLVAVTVLKGRMSVLRLPAFRNFVPVAMLLFGSVFVLRGMNLGIPYLSPKIEVTQTGVKACCCHKVKCNSTIAGK